MFVLLTGFCFGSSAGDNDAVDNGVFGNFSFGARIGVGFVATLVCSVGHAETKVVIDGPVLVEVTVLVDSEVAVFAEVVVVVVVLIAAEGNTTGISA